MPRKDMYFVGYCTAQAQPELAFKCVERKADKIHIGRGSNPTQEVNITISRLLEEAIIPEWKPDKRDVWFNFELA